MDTSEIKADMSFNKCGTDTWVCIAEQAARCSLDIKSWSIYFATFDCFETRKIQNCLQKFGTTCLHDSSSPYSYVRQAINASNEYILTNGCVDTCVAEKLRDCNSNYALEEKSAIFDRLRLCSTRTKNLECLNDIVSYCNSTHKLSSQGFTFLHINDTMREIQDMIANIGCQHVNGCASDELQHCFSAYTSAKETFERTKVAKCIATSIYMECINKIQFVCYLRSTSASQSDVFSYINDTRSKVHEWMLINNCFSDEVCAQAKAYKCPARYKKESKEKEPDTLAVCSAAYDCDRCYKTIVFDCSLSNGSLVFVSLQKAIDDLEWQIGKGGCPSVEDSAAEKILDCSSKYALAKKATKNDRLKFCR